MLYRNALAPSTPPWYNVPCISLLVLYSYTVFLSVSDAVPFSWTSHPSLFPFPLPNPFMTHTFSKYMRPTLTQDEEKEALLSSERYRI